MGFWSVEFLDHLSHYFRYSSWVVERRASFAVRRLLKVLHFSLLLSEKIKAVVTIFGFKQLENKRSLIYERNTLPIQESPRGQICKKKKKKKPPNFKKCEFFSTQTHVNKLNAWLRCQWKALSNLWNSWPLFMGFRS